jgi:branched-chain amino acid transport system ATP-binding protein
MSLLETRDLSKFFGALAVTQDVNLRFEPGMRYAVIGPNGAGKTTLFNLLSGELKPSAGKIMLDGADLTARDPAGRARAGIARSFQRNNLFPDLTVHDNLAIACAVKAGVMPIFWRSFRGFRSLHECAGHFANQVGLADDRAALAHTLSYGSQRQLEVGLALACEPKVLLLDEPTSGMSPEETLRMQRLIGALPRSLTMIVIEHDMDIVLGFADRIIVLDYGRVLAQGTPAEIRASSVVRERYLGEAPVDATMAMPPP